MTELVSVGAPHPDPRSRAASRTLAWESGGWCPDWTGLCLPSALAPSMQGRTGRRGLWKGSPRSRSWEVLVFASDLHARLQEPVGSGSHLGASRRRRPSSAESARPNQTAGGPVTARGQAAATGGQALGIRTCHLEPACRSLSKGKGARRLSPGAPRCFVQSHSRPRPRADHARAVGEPPLTNGPQGL